MIPCARAVSSLRLKDIYEMMAHELARGAAVAWYEGGVELGPRAVGHRNFLSKRN